MTPEYVFEGQHFNLSCRSFNISQTQITAKVKYSLYKDNNRLIDGHVFNTTASTANSGNYYCKAAAEGITKVSMPLVINVKGKQIYIAFQYMSSIMSLASNNE